MSRTPSSTQRYVVQLWSQQQTPCSSLHVIPCRVILQQQQKDMRARTPVHKHMCQWQPAAREPGLLCLLPCAHFDLVCLLHHCNIIMCVCLCVYILTG